MWDSDVFRWVAIGEVSFLLSVGVYLWMTLGRTVPAVLRAVTPGYALIFAAVGVGVLANALSTIPPTPGVKVLAVVGAPAVTWVACAMLRHRHQP